MSCVGCLDPRCRRREGRRKPWIQRGRGRRPSLGRQNHPGFPQITRLRTLAHICPSALKLQIEFIHLQSITAETDNYLNHSKRQLSHFSIKKKEAHLKMPEGMGPSGCTSRRSTRGSRCPGCRPGSRGCWSGPPPTCCGCTAALTLLEEKP